MVFSTMSVISSISVSSTEPVRVADNKITVRSYKPTMVPATSLDRITEVLDKSKEVNNVEKKDVIEEYHKITTLPLAAVPKEETAKFVDDKEEKHEKLDIQKTVETENKKSKETSEVKDQIVISPAKSVKSEKNSRSLTTPMKSQSNSIERGRNETISKIKPNVDRQILNKEI